MAADCDRDLLRPINTRKNDEMNLPTMKTSVLPRIGLRRGVPTALAIVATLALVSSAQADTYTWTGASGANADWFTTALNSANFSSSPLVSSTATTDLLFSGTTRPSTVLNSNFNTRSITFNTGTGFTISPLVNQGLNVGAGGIANLVAHTQTIEPTVIFQRPGGIVPINVAADGTVIMGRMGASTSFSNTEALEKTGPGTLTFRGQGFGLLKITEGTVNINTDVAQTQFAARFELNGGELNVPAGKSIGFYQASKQTGGVLNLLGQLEGDTFDMTGGTMNVGESTTIQRGPSTFSSGTVSYVGEVGGGMTFGNDLDYDTVPSLVISGGTQDFGAGSVIASTALATLVTGGTTSGFYSMDGVTNDGGSITFTAIDAGLTPTYNTPGPATNKGKNLTFTSGIVSISTIGGSTPAIGSLVNGTIDEPLNTFLGAGNTLNLDFNEDLSRDLLITSGTLNWDGNVALNLTNLGEVANGSSWNFFNDGVLGNTGDYAGTLSGISLAATDTYNDLTFSKSGSLWTSTSTVGGQRFTFDETSGVLAVVPEPSSIAAAGIGLAMLGWRRLARRRRAAA